jgi:hypothetical protein
MATVSSEALQTFQDYKLRGSGSYLIYQLTGNGQIEVTTKGTEQKEWQAFVAELPVDKACWAVKSFHYETKEGGKRSKCLLIQVTNHLLLNFDTSVDSNSRQQKG